MSTIVHTRFPSVEAAKLADITTEHLRMYFRHVVNVTWTLVLEHGEIVARCEVHARSGRIFGEGRDAAVDAALHQAFERIVAQRRRQKRTAKRSLRLGATVRP